jgi:hypothetical protein
MASVEAVAAIAGKLRPRNVFAFRSWMLRLKEKVPGPVVLHPVRIRDSSATSPWEYPPSTPSVWSSMISRA